MSFGGRHLIAATVTDIGEGLFLYPACRHCYSKLLESGNGKNLSCRKCSCDYKPRDVYYRYCLHLMITDGSCLANVTAFGGILDCFFGASGSVFYQKTVLKMREKYGTLSEVMMRSAVEKTFVGQNLIFGFKLSKESFSLRKQHCASLALKELCNTTSGYGSSQSCLPELIALQVLPQTNSLNIVTVCRVLDNLVSDIEKLGLSYSDYLNADKTKFLDHYLEMLSAPFPIIRGHDSLTEQSSGRDDTLYSSSSMTMDETSIGLSCDGSLEQMYVQEMHTPSPKKDRCHEHAGLLSKPDLSSSYLPEPETKGLNPLKLKCLPEERRKKTCLNYSVGDNFSRKCADKDANNGMMNKNDEGCVKSFPKQRLSTTDQLLLSECHSEPAYLECSVNLTAIKSSDFTTMLNSKKKLIKHDSSHINSTTDKLLTTFVSADVLCGDGTPKFRKIDRYSPTHFHSPPEILRGCARNSPSHSCPSFTGKNYPLSNLHPDTLQSTVNKLDLSDSSLSSNYDFIDQSSSSSVTNSKIYISPIFQPLTSIRSEGLHVGNTLATDLNMKTVTVCHDMVCELPESEALDEFLQEMNPITTEGVLTNTANTTNGNSRREVHSTYVGHNKKLFKNKKIKNSQDSSLDIAGPVHYSKRKRASQTELKAKKSKILVLSKHTSAKKIVNSTGNTYSSCTDTENSCHNESFQPSPEYAQSRSLNVTLRRSQKNDFKHTQTLKYSSKISCQNVLINRSKHNDTTDMPESEDLWQFLDCLGPHEKIENKSCGNSCETKTISVLDESKELLGLEKENVQYHNKSQTCLVFENENKSKDALNQNFEFYSEDLFSSPDFSASVHNCPDSVKIVEDTSECISGTGKNYVECRRGTDTSLVVCESITESSSPSKQESHPSTSSPTIRELTSLESLSAKNAMVLVAFPTASNPRKSTSCKSAGVSPTLKYLSESCNSPVYKSEFSDSLDLFSSQEDCTVNSSTSNLNDLQTDKENHITVSNSYGNRVPLKRTDLNLMQTPVVCKRLCQTRKTSNLFKKVRFTPDRHELHFCEFEIISHLPLLPRKVLLKSCLKKQVCKDKEVSCPYTQSVTHCDTCKMCNLPVQPNLISTDNDLFTKDCPDLLSQSTLECQTDFFRHGTGTYNTHVTNQGLGKPDYLILEAQHKEIKVKCSSGGNQDETSLDLFSQSQTCLSPAVGCNSDGLSPIRYNRHPSPAVGCHSDSLSPKRYNSHVSQDCLTPDLFSPTVCSTEHSDQECFTPDLFS